MGNLIARWVCFVLYAGSVVGAGFLVAHVWVGAINPLHLVHAVCWPFVFRISANTFWLYYDTAKTYAERDRIYAEMAARRASR